MMGDGGSNAGRRVQVSIWEEARCSSLTERRCEQVGEAGSVRQPAIALIKPWYREEVQFLVFSFAQHLERPGAEYASVGAGTMGKTTAPTAAPALYTLEKARALDT